MQSLRKTEPEPEVAAEEGSGIRRIPDAPEDLTDLAVLVPSPPSPPPVPILRRVEERVDPDQLLREYLPRAPYDDRLSTYPGIPARAWPEPSPEPPPTVRVIFEVPPRATRDTVLVVLFAAALIGVTLAL